MKKGSVVKCVKQNHDGDYFVEGKEYEVLAGEGESNKVCGGFICDRGMVIMSELGKPAYCVFPECLFGQWELVK